MAAGDRGYPRHLFVPHWWRASAAGSGDGSNIWERCDGPAEEDTWARAAYRDQSLVTRVGPLHADHAGPGNRPVGLPTSSATLPGLIVQMLRHAHIDTGADVLDVGTGSGYGCAVLSRRLGDQHVTSVDVDAYLTKVAAERLAGIGLRPQVMTGDATGPLPGSYDRIVSTVAVRPIPASWLAALRPGGRLVTTHRHRPDPHRGQDRRRRRDRAHRMGPGRIHAHSDRRGLPPWPEREVRGHPASRG